MVSLVSITHTHYARSTVITYKNNIRVQVNQTSDHQDDQHRPTHRFRGLFLDMY